MRILLTDTTWTMAMLARDLRASGFFVTEAADMAEVLEFARNGQQDAVVIDPDLPDGDAVALVQAVRRTDLYLPVCLHMPSATLTDRARFMAAGADDVFDRRTCGAEVAARLRAYVRRAAGHATSRITFGDLVIDLDTQAVRVLDTPVRLTRLEYELVETMALRGGALITRDEIMLQLYAWQDEPDSKIIDVYICRIRAKMAAAGARGEVVATCFAQGYRLNPQSSVVPPMAA